MNLLELYEKIPDGYYSEKDDNTAIRATDTRKTRLTLDRLNKLRAMNDTRKLEHEQMLDKVSKQYQPPQQAAGGGLGL
jgi:hypothetical protein